MYNKSVLFTFYGVAEGAYAATPHITFEKIAS